MNNDLSDTDRLRLMERDLREVKEVVYEVRSEAKKTNGRVTELEVQARIRQALDVSHAKAISTWQAFAIAFGSVLFAGVADYALRHLGG